MGASNGKDNSQQKKIGRGSTPKRHREIEEQKPQHYKNTKQYNVELDLQLNSVPNNQAQQNMENDINNSQQQQNINNNDEKSYQIIEDNQQDILIMFDQVAVENGNVQGYSENVITNEQAIQLVGEIKSKFQLNYEPISISAYFMDSHDEFQQNFGIQGANEKFYIKYGKFYETFFKAVKNQEINQDQGMDKSQGSQLGNTQQNNLNDYQNGQGFSYNIMTKKVTEPSENNFANIYTRHNNMILSNFINRNSQQLLNYFTDFSKNQDGEPLVKVQDIPLIIRVGFYIDNITFHKNKEDAEEFFNLEDSYKIMLSHMDTFLSEEQRIDTKNIDIGAHEIGFELLLSFVEYFLNNEPNIFLRRSDNEDQGFDLDEAEAEEVEGTGIEKEIRSNIQKYELLMNEAKTESESKVITNMLNALYKQLQTIVDEKEKKNINNQSKLSYRQKISQNEIKKKNLLEIFNFYCRQQYTVAPKQSFDRILYTSHVMNLSNFLLFAKQFEITNFSLKVTKKSLPGYFQSVSSNYKDISFQEFQMLLEKLAVLMYEDETEHISHKDRIEKLYAHIGLNNQTNFRQKLHQLNPPFNIQDPEGFRSLPKDQGRNIKLKKIPPKLHAALEQRKNERKVLVQKYSQSQQYNTPQPQSKANNILYNDNYSINNNSMTNLDQSIGNYSPLKPQKSVGQIGGYTNSSTIRSPLKKVNQKSYKEQNIKKKIQQNQMGNKVSWQQLQKISYTDLKQVHQANPSFKPTDLFDEKNDTEDFKYLQQYNFQDEQQKKLESTYIHKKEQEQYGIYKQPMRPTLAYMLKHDSNYNQKQNNTNLHRMHGYETYNSSNIFQSQPSQYQQSNYYTGDYSPIYKNDSQIGQNYMQRAQQIENIQNQRENQILTNIKIPNQSYKYSQKNNQQNNNYQQNHRRYNSGQYGNSNYSTQQQQVY